MSESTQSVSNEALLAAIKSLQAEVGRLGGQVAPEYLSIQQAAAFTSLSQDHIRRAILGGVLPASNVGTPNRPLYRVSRESVRTWMREREAGPKPPLRKGRLKKSQAAPKPVPPSPHFPQSRRPASPSTCSELSA